MQIIIDRFEGDFAVCENQDGTMLNIEKYRLPKDAQESDVIVLKDDEYVIDKSETEKRRQLISKLEVEIFNKPNEYNTTP